MKNKKTNQPPKDSFIDLLKNIIFCLKVLYQVNKKVYIVKIPLILIQSASTFIPIIFTRYILNEITVGKNMSMVFAYVGMMVGFHILFNLISIFLGKQDAREMEKANYRIKQILGESVMNLKYSNLEEPQTKDFIKIASETNSFMEVLGNVSSFISSLLNVLGLTAIILTIQPIVLVLILFVVFTKFIINKQQIKINYLWNHQAATFNRKMEYLMFLMIFPQYGKEVRINNLAGWINDKFEESLNIYLFPYFKKFMAKDLKFRGLTEGILLLQQILIYLYLSYRVVFKGMLIGDFSMYLTSIEKFSSGVSGIMGNITNLISNGVFVKEFKMCLEMSMKEKQLAEQAEKKQGYFPMERGTLCFNNVSFRYPNTERMILQNISFSIPFGGTLSIVGVNGAGKTTLVKLICRLYEPTEGEITLNDIPIQQIPFHEYVKKIGVVFQDFKLYSCSVAENIAADTIWDEKKLYDSIEKSGLSEKVSSLPERENTMLFREFDENGIEFSGGEGQKLAIARALYKDASFMILDEPTSALDPIAEYEIYHRFHEMANGKSAIFISHRLSSARFTDKVMVLSEGLICEYGSHDELMNIENGVYKNMFQMQAQYYE